jgi:hypothetical protein
MTKITYVDNIDEALKILARRDGTVVKASPYGDIMAQQGNVGISIAGAWEPLVDGKPAPQSLNVNSASVQVMLGTEKQVKEGGAESIIAMQDGRILGGQRYSCDFTMKLRDVVAGAMKDGKLTVQEASEIQSLARSAPKKDGGKQCDTSR